MSSDRARSVAQTIGTLRVVRERSDAEAEREALTKAIDICWERLADLDGDAPVEEPDELDAVTIRQRVVSLDRIQESVDPGQASVLAIARKLLDEKQAAMEAEA